MSSQSDTDLDRDQLKKDLILDEGYRTHPYLDTKGILTGGIGHNLIAHHCSLTDIAEWKGGGIPPAIINGWFDDDVFDAEEVVKGIFDIQYDALPGVVKRVLINMAFDLQHGLAQWNDTIGLIRAKQWGAAADAIGHSLFARQAPNRIARLQVLLRGVEE